MPRPAATNLRTSSPQRARLAVAAVDEELVLERALDAVGVAEVVDRGAARVEAGLQRRDDGVAQRGDLRALQRPASRSGWIAARNSASLA